MTSLVDESRGRLVWRVRAVPHLRPAEDRQGSAGQAPAARLDQVELVRSVLVELVAFGAEVRRDGDPAIEGEDALMQLLGVLHDLARVARFARAEGLPGQQAAADEDEEDRQAEVEGLACACSSHCRPSQVRDRKRG